MFTYIVTFGLLCGASHWFFARASITRWFWSRARGPFANLLACAACSGAWLGLGAMFCGVRPLALVPWTTPILEVFGTMALGMALTPLFEAGLLWGLAVTAIEEAPPAPEDGADA